MQSEPWNDASLPLAERFEALYEVLKDRPRSRPHLQALRSLYAYRDEMVMANKGLIATAIGYLPDRVVQMLGSRDDAFQEAMVPLIRSAELFDPRMGLRFSTYAVKSICRYLTTMAPARTMIGVPISAYRKGCEPPANAGDKMLPGLVNRGNDERPLIHIDDQEAIDGMLEVLSKRERKIVLLYFFEYKTLEFISQRLKLCKQRVNQIKANALEKMRRAAIRKGNQPCD